MCAQVRISDSSGVLWMIVPEPKPVERLLRTRIRTDGFPWLGIGKRRSRPRLARRRDRRGPAFLIRPVLARASTLVIVVVGSALASSPDAAWALELTGGCALAAAAL